MGLRAGAGATDGCDGAHDDAECEVVVRDGVQRVGCGDVYAGYSSW